MLIIELRNRHRESEVIKTRCHAVQTILALSSRRRSWRDAAETSCVREKASEAGHVR